MNTFTDYEFEERLKEVDRLRKGHFGNFVHAVRIMQELREFLLTPNSSDPTEKQNKWDEVNARLNGN